MKRTLLAVAALPFVLPVPAAHAGGGCGQPMAEQEVPMTGTAAEVRIDHACFTPAVIAVKRGTRVTWRNLSDLDHNISGARIAFGDLKASGGTFAEGFDEPGFYPYACTLHPGMSGVVHVLSGEDRPVTTAAAAATDDSSDSGTPVAPYAAAGLAIAGVAAFAGARTARRRGVRLAPVGIAPTGE